MNLSERKPDPPPNRMLGHTLAVRAIRQDKREVDFICSTEDLDSYGTVLRQAGCDLTRFSDNPTVLYSHNACDLPVGHATSFGVEGGKLIATVRVATAAANPKAENVWQSIIEQTLRGISVGFIPLEYHWEKDAEGDGETLVYDRWSLCELSITPLPSNPSALAQHRAMALEQRAAAPAAAPTPPTKTPAADIPSPGTPAVERGEQKETRMDLEKENAALKEKVSQREIDLRSAEQKLAEERKLTETERTAKVAIERELDKTRADLIAATSRAAKAEEAIVERDVKALVGDKITPAEVDEMTELAKTNRGLFDKLIAKRAPLQETRRVVHDEPVDNQSRGIADAEAELVALAMKGA